MFLPSCQVVNLLFMPQQANRRLTVWNMRESSCLFQPSHSGGKRLELHKILLYWALFRAEHTCHFNLMSTGWTKLWICQQMAALFLAKCHAKKTIIFAERRIWTFINSVSSNHDLTRRHNYLRNPRKQTCQRLYEKIHFQTWSLINLDIKRGKCDKNYEVQSLTFLKVYLTSHANTRIRLKSRRCHPNDTMITF